MRVVWWEGYAGRGGLAAYMHEMLEPRFEGGLAVRIDEKRWSRTFC